MKGNILKEVNEIRQMMGLVNESADRPYSLTLNERRMLGGLMNRMGDYFPDWLSNYGFERKHTYNNEIDTISYTNGSEQLVFKVRDLFDGKFSDVYVGASGDIIPSLMSNYKGKEYPLEKMEKLFDTIGRDVVSRYEEIKKNGYNVVSKVDLPNGNYTLSGSGSIGQIMKNGEPTNFYLLLKDRVRGSFEDKVNVSNGIVKGGENYGGILSMLRK